MNEQANRAVKLIKEYQAVWEADRWIFLGNSFLANEEERRAVDAYHAVDSELSKRIKAAEDQRRREQQAARIAVLPADLQAIQERLIILRQLRQEYNQIQDSLDILATPSKHYPRMAYQLGYRMEAKNAIRRFAPFPYTAESDDLQTKWERQIHNKGSRYAKALASMPKDDDLQWDVRLEDIRRTFWAEHQEVLDAYEEVKRNVNRRKAHRRQELALEIRQALEAIGPWEEKEDGN